MAKKLIKKSEKYIREVIRSNGNHFLRIEIRMKDQSFSKTIAINDFDTPSQALQFACSVRDETLRKINTGFTVGSFPTVAELYQKTFEVLEPVTIKTRKKHDIFYRQAILPYASKTIDQVTPADIQQSLNLYSQNHTSKQITHLLAVWRRLYSCCDMLNINIIDCTKKVKIPRGIPSKPRSKDISSADLGIFLEALKEYNVASEAGHYYSMAVYFLIQIMRFTGARPAEVIAITKSDIDLISNYVSIDKAVRSSSDDIQQLRETKTESSNRKIPICEELKPILKEALSWSRFEVLLTDIYGRYLNVDEIDTMIGNIRKKLRKNGIEIDFRLYQLRHQLSTDLHKSGTNPATIRDIMGHKSSSMSLDYATSSESDRLDAINQRQFS